VAEEEELVADADLERFALTLKRLRLLAGLTRPAAAQEVGCTPRQLEHWEKAGASPHIRYILRLAQVFKVTTDELLGYEPNPEAVDDATRDAITALERMFETMGLPRNVTINVQPRGIGQQFNQYLPGSYRRSTPTRAHPDADISTEQTRPVEVKAP
jgi:transcriptional regulator with XRE-family HTH domain